MLRDMDNNSSTKHRSSSRHDQWSWDEAEIDAFRIASLYDPSLPPDREPSESESQIKKEVKLTIKCAKKRLNEQN